MTWTLRPASESDIEFLLALRAATMSPHHVAHGIVQTEDEAHQRVLARLDCARIVVKDGHDVGLVKLVPATPDWELWQLQLLPMLHRQGLGGALVHRAIEEAAAAGCGVVLTVLAKNPARRLYERFGFRVVAPEGHGVRMRRPFAPHAPVPPATAPQA
jgi:GNAT superfamily N-acetyltransferase